MSRSRFLLVAIITIIFVFAAAAFRPAVSPTPVGSLTPATPMLEPRSGHSATLLPDGKVLIAGGMRRNQDFYKSAEIYDPATGKFHPTGEMNVGRVGHIAVLLRPGKVLIAGGWVGGKRDRFGRVVRLRHRQVHGDREKDDHPARRPSATLLADGDVLIAGGEESDNESLASAEIFHVKTLSFESTGAMHHARISHTATLLKDGRVLIAGG